MVGLVAAIYSAAFTFGVVNRIETPLAIGPAKLPVATARMGDIRLLAAIQRSAKSQGIPPGAPEAAVLLAPGKSTFAPADIRAIHRDAQETLRLTPLASEGLRQLAFIEGDLVRRERLLGLAHSVTRRDVLASLQLAELRLRRNEVRLGLTGLNRALVVSRALDEVVFPMLAGAAADPRAAEQIKDLLRPDPDWAERLVRWAIANPQSLPPLSGQFSNLPKNSAARDAGYGQQMIDLLANQRRYAEAFAVYRTYAPGPQAIGDLTVGTFQPIDWRLIDNYDTAGRPFGKGMVEIFASPGRQGDVAQIVTQLRPGRQRFALRLDEAVGRDAELQLSVNCAKPADDTALAGRRVKLANGSTAFDFTVPATGCSFQRLTIGLAAGNESASALLRSASFGGGTPAAPGGA